MMGRNAKCIAMWGVVACACSACDQVGPFLRLAASGKTLGGRNILALKQVGGTSESESAGVLASECGVFDDVAVVDAMDPGKRAARLATCRAELVKRASRQIDVIVEECKRYVLSEQKYGDPWHEPGDGDGEADGVPVAWAHYVTPGGVNVDIATQPAPNVLLMPRAPRMGDDEVAAALADHLDRGFGSPGSDGVPNPFRAPSLFTFTYRTGDGSGMDAWCEASASAPLGAGGETVTITKGGEVDQRSQEFIISPFELEGPRSLFAAAGLTGGPSAGTAPSGGYDARAPSRDDGERPDVVLEEWTPPERDDVESGDVPAAVRDAAPKRMVSALARMCRSYYVRSQRYTGGDGGEPWHFGGARGTEVPKNKKLFPGGTNQRLTSTSEVPSGGKPVSPSPEAPKHLDEMLALFGNPFKEPSIYQYKVETGPGMGAGARCIVTATTDLNPASPERHTLRQVVRVDPDTLELTVQPLVETNAYE